MWHWTGAVKARCMLGRPVSHDYATTGSDFMLNGSLSLSLSLILPLFHFYLLNVITESSLPTVSVASLVFISSHLSHKAIQPKKRELI